MLTPTFKSISLIIATLAITIVFSGNSYAAEKDKSSRRAALMMQKMKQDMEAEKTAMQTQFDTQKKELEDTLKKSEDANKELEVKVVAEKRKSAGLQANLIKEQAEKLALDNKLQQTQASLDTTQKSLVDMTSLHKQAVADLKANDTQRKTQLINIAQTSKSLQNCEAKNDKLYHYGLDLIKVYDKPSAYQAAIRTEQFTQIKRVEIENILQEYRDKIDVERASVTNN